VLLLQVRFPGLPSTRRWLRMRLVRVGKSLFLVNVCVCMRMRITISMRTCIRMRMCMLVAPVSDWGCEELLVFDSV
jgi:hypothetical protein